jgi:hypothetical protein
LFVARRALFTVLTVALAATSLAACTSSANGGQSTSSRAATTTSPSTTAPTTALSTTTTAVRSTTTAEANAAIAAWAKSREGTTDISIGNLADGAVADITPGPQTTVRIASVMKVSIAIAFLRLRAEQKDALTQGELIQLGLLIEASDNREADRLWSASGGASGLAATIAAARLTNTAYQPGYGWGFSLTNAHDQALLATALGRGKLLSPTDTRLLLALMRNVQPNQNWGFVDTVAPAVEPAIKNGWYDDKDVPVWRVHCMAIFDDPTFAHPFSIVVMTRYPAKLGIEYGQATCRGVGKRLGAWIATK